MPRGVYERKPKVQAEVSELPRVEKPKEMTAEEIAAAKEKATKANQDRNMSRVEMMDAIADNNDAIRAPDMEETDGTVVFKDEAQEREEAEVQEAADAERELAEAQAKELQAEGVETDADEKEINGVKHYLQIVNGKEKWQTLKQIRETAQKVESGDEYLRAAAESVRTSAGRALSESDEPAKLAKEELRKTLSAAVLGDEQALDTLASVLARPSGLTPDDVKQIDQRLSLKTEVAQAEAEQQEVLSNPYLKRAFYSELAELRQEAPSTTILTAYRGIGKKLREAFPEKFKKPAVTLTDKETRKRSLPAPVVSAGRQVQEQEEEGEESVESVIAEMAKARGQGHPVVHARGHTTNFAKPEK